MDSNVLFLENAPCPHSWAITQNPIAVVPDINEYMIQIGIIFGVNGIDKPVATTKN